MMSSIFERAFAGEVFSDIEIIDAHCHMGNIYQFSIAPAGIDEMLRDADRVGVNQLAVCPHAALNSDYRHGNRQLMQAIQKHPSRVLGLLTLNGNFPDEMPMELASYANAPQFIGIKLHPSMHSARVNDVGSMRAIELMQELGGFVLLHTWQGCGYCDPALCEDALRAFPTVPIIFAHLAGTREGVMATARLMEKYDNCWGDTSGFEYSATPIEEILQIFDPKRIVYGSDMPYHDMRPPFARVALANIDDEVKKDVFAWNFKRLLALNPKTSWGTEMQ